MNKITLVGIVVLFNTALVANTIDGNDQFSVGDNIVIKEELSRDSLIRELEELSSKDNPAKILATLFATPNKETIQLMNGVTVSNLVALRNFNYDQCYDGLDDHFEVCKRVTNKPRLLNYQFFKTSLSRSLEIYCDHMRELIENYCFEIAAEKFETRLMQMINQPKESFNVYARMPLFSLERTEELSKEKLIEKLETATKAWQVVRVLYKAKDKEVINGVTVEKLIEFSVYQRLKCSQRRQQSRSKFCKKLRLKSLRTYCKYVQDKMEDLCYDVGMLLVEADVKKISNTGQARVFSYPMEEKHPSDELIKVLASAKKPEDVARALMETKDKETVELAKGVKVANLIALNTLNRHRCLQRSMVGVCEKFQKVNTAKSLSKPLRKYCEHIEKALGDYCNNLAEELMQQMRIE